MRTCPQRLPERGVVCSSAETRDRSLRVDETPSGSQRELRTDVQVVIGVESHDPSRAQSIVAGVGGTATIRVSRITVSGTTTLASDAFACDSIRRDTATGIEDTQENPGCCSR